jgi:hypothetical protein
LRAHIRLPAPSSRVTGWPYRLPTGPAVPDASLWPWLSRLTLYRGKKEKVLFAEAGLQGAQAGCFSGTSVVTRGTCWPHRFE